jgi:hypothetical protein
MIKGMAEPTPKPAKKSVKILEENEVVPDINVNEEDILQMIKRSCSNKKSDSSSRSSTT